MKALPIKLLICHLLFLFQGIDSLFFDYQKTLFKAIEAYVDHAWVLMTITMILTAVNALIVLTSLGYYWPRIFRFFKRSKRR